jgi:methylthioribose-1-phosphate isomerase
MKVAGHHYRTIEYDGTADAVTLIDQTVLPHEFATLQVADTDGIARAIRDMIVRGAPLIGAAAAYGIAFAVRDDASHAARARAAEQLIATRPTAVNLRWAVERMLAAIADLEGEAAIARAFVEAQAICDEDVLICEAIGDAGLPLIRELAARKPADCPVDILTHCNAGWLATVDWGTALAPIYKAHESGVPVHVWVDETRPRNQGASLTTWELAQAGVPHTLIVDNVGGHLMQQGRVDLCIVGSDRTTASGDVCNKIGTYLKALAANDNGVPFYVALPTSTIDWEADDGVRDIPIEERDGDEVLEIAGRNATGAIESVALAPSGTRAANFAFDVTPARLVTALVTDRGVVAPTREALATLKD